MGVGNDPSTIQYGCRAVVSELLDAGDVRTWSIARSVTPVRSPQYAEWLIHQPERDRCRRADERPGERDHTCQTNGIALQGYLLTDGLEAPARPGEVDRPVRETNVPMPERTVSPRESTRNP